VIFIFTMITLSAFCQAWAEGYQVKESSKLSVYISGAYLEITANLDGNEFVSIDLATPDDLVVHRESKEPLITLPLQPDFRDGLYRYDLQVVDPEYGITTDRLAGNFKVENGQIIFPETKEREGQQGFLERTGKFIAFSFRCIVDFLAEEAHAADLTASDLFNPGVYFDETDGGSGEDWVIGADGDGAFAAPACDGNTTGFAIFDDVDNNCRKVFELQDGINSVNTFIADDNGDISFADSGMFFDRSARRLGINTTVPAYLIDAVGSSRISLRESTLSTADTIMLRTDGAAVDIEAQNAELFIRTDGGTTDYNIYMLPGSQNVGIGMTEPEQKLHVNGNILSNGNFAYMAQTANPGFWLDETGAGNKGLYSVLDGKVLQLQRRAQDFGAFEASIFKVYLEAPTNSFFLRNNGYIGFGRDPSHPIHSSTGAFLSAAGIWVNASSREYKENIKELTVNEAVDMLRGLNPLTYTAKASPEEKHVGFIAEDVPEMVATNDRKGLSPMDIVAVITKVVQEQQKAMEEQQKSISSLTGKVQELEKEIKLVRKN
jgi:hypothetical protein